MMVYTYTASEDLPNDPFRLSPTDPLHHSPIHYRQYRCGGSYGEVALMDTDSLSPKPIDFDDIARDDRITKADVLDYLALLIEDDLISEQQVVDYFNKYFPKKDR